MGPLPTENVVTELTIGEDGSRMVVFGGRVNNAPNNETFVLNTATGAWTQGPSADSRMYPACTIVGDLLLVWGGTIPGEKIANGDMLIYNYITSMWLNSYTPPASLQDLVPPKIPTTVTLGTNSPTSPSSPSSTVSRPPVTSIGSPSGIATQGGGGDNDTSSNLGAVVGGVVGALAVVLAVFMLYRRKQQQGSAQKEVPLLSVKTTNSDNNSTNNSNHGDDDDEQDSAKKYVAGFGPIQSIRLMDKQTLGRGSDGYASSAAVVGTPEQGPQAIVQMGNSPMNMRLRDLEIQQQQLDLKWQLLMLQQQEQQLRSPIQQQLYQQQQQQLQLQQQQQQQQQSQLQQQIYQLGGREARGTVVSANTSVGSTNMRSLGSYTRQEYDDFSSFHTSTPPTVHTCLETGDWNRRYSNLDVEPTRIPNNPHPHPETDLWNRVYSNLDVEPIRIPNNPHTSVPH
ncbi:hypothetical protein BGZ96_006688 [Linnemannia gamsii]|uniref:Galactose oxidase n=1 Tax=Linnemannia gamsii TaxID=64522 RepID=A0ABQ7K2B2_9FUNG|nr:hypothetical protein BGZ96_006688 [Linnemannia gamsii]